MASPTTNSPNSRALVAFPFQVRLERNASSRSTLVSPLVVGEETEQWQPILHSSNQVVLYNPRSHALSITTAAESNTPGVVVARRREDVHPSRVIAEACPYCGQGLPPGFDGYGTHEHRAQDDDEDDEGRWEDFVDESPSDGEFSADPAYHSRASNYFRLLEISNVSSSRRASPSPGGYERERRWSRSRSRTRSRGRSRTRTRTPDASRSTTSAFPAEKMAEGYFKTFFQEEFKLGMGANGSVFLCQHVLDGNPLGHFAVKKIAVGESHSYLLKILREVRLLERLHHPNIVTYHHAWLETAQFSSFGPKVPTLHVLMQWAEGGSLDDFIDIRLGRKTAHIHMHRVSSTLSSAPSSPASSTKDLPDQPTTPTLISGKGKGPQFAAETQPPHESSAAEGDPHSRSARIRAFRAYQRAPPEEKERMRREMEEAAGSSASGAPRTEWTPVHLLSAEEVKSLFRDVVEGLSFLHDKSILHLDLKPGNVLLTWDEGKLIPRAMLSDFGTSRDMINSTRVARSGNTGTLEYTAPETLPSPETGLLQQIGSKADMWSLGMILHKLLFFKLPYRYAAAGDANGEPISRNEEGEKLERLEKEVLNYPGFKSTPDLVAGFETRRLPRAFLVLLENLLHKSPAGRPSSERVSTAIREGKLDPLAARPAQNLPLSRLWTNASEGSTVATSPAGGATVDGTVPPEQSRLLALPSPTEILGPDERSWRAWASWKLWTRFIMETVIGVSDSEHRRRRKKRRQSRTFNANANRFVRRGMGMRIVRSALLVAKVLTIPRLCLDPTTRPRPVVAALLLAVAVVDSVIDHDGVVGVGHEREERGRERSTTRRRWMSCIGRRMGSVWITVGLALFHVGVLGLSGALSGSAPWDWWGQLCCIPMDGGYLLVSTPV
ncbi:hypothetical protein M413DRAFT_444837 [Hebeloma cylindrosporum]|uniref:non-specific serine/threonine protein kinase n=1 Tax=Hebeloma cylindrosporum TaxID=76867 RepID=A0A0C3C0K5_HEBCY|nr:hypothetical protein M413DRAFT_444837 [Hebeloma cylindrosporum h7]